MKPNSLPLQPSGDQTTSRAADPEETVAVSLPKVPTHQPIDPEATAEIAPNTIDPEKTGLPHKK